MKTSHPGKYYSRDCFLRIISVAKCIFGYSKKAEKSTCITTMTTRLLSIITTKYLVEISQLTREFVLFLVKSSHFSMLGMPETRRIQIC